MRKNKLILALKIMILILFSCKKDLKKDYEKEFDNTNGHEIISIDIDKEDKNVKLSDFIDSIDLIKLETNRNCLIGSIDKIEITDNYIYILDQLKSKSLFVFKKNGEFLKKIGKVGKGPGEYSSIWDFCIIDDRKLFILDFTQNKLLFYENFKYTKSKRLKTLVESITNNDSFYYSKPFKDISIKVPDVLIQDNEFKTISEKFYSPPNISNSTSFRYNFRKYKDSITYIRHLENKVYRIKNKKIIPKYYFDFGDDGKTYKEAYFSNSEDSKNFPSLSGDFYENEKHVFFTFSYKHHIYNALYNKSTKTLKHSKFFNINNVKGGYSTDFKNSNEKSIFGTIEASEVKELDEEIKEKYNLTDVNDYDNPIITISYYK